MVGGRWVHNPPPWDYASHRTDPRAADSSARILPPTTRQTRRMRRASTRCWSSGAAWVPERASSRSAREPDRRHGGCSSSERIRSSSSSRTLRWRSTSRRCTETGWSSYGRAWKRRISNRRGSTSPQRHRRSTGWTRRPALHALHGAAAGRVVGDLVDALRRGRSAGPIHRATSPLLDGLARSPSQGRGGPAGVRTRPRTPGRGTRSPPGSRRRARAREVGRAVGHRREYAPCTAASRRSSGLDEAHRERILDEIARIASDEFGGRVIRDLTTSLYTARKPP